MSMLPCGCQVVITSTQPTQTSALASLRDDIAVTATRHMRRFRIVPAGFATFMDDLLQVARIKAWQCLMAGMPPNHAVADARSAAQDALRVERHGPSKRRTKRRMLTVEVAEHAIPVTCREVARCR